MKERIAEAGVGVRVKTEDFHQKGTKINTAKVEALSRRKDHLKHASIAKKRAILKGNALNSGNVVGHAQKRGLRSRRLAFWCFRKTVGSAWTNIFGIMFSEREDQEAGGTIFHTCRKGDKGYIIDFIVIEGLAVDVLMGTAVMCQLQMTINCKEEYVDIGKERYHFSWKNSRQVGKVYNQGNNYQTRRNN